MRNHFWGAEVILAANFLSQSTAYWVHRPLPAFVHFPAVAGPYAWTLTALFWNGAVAVGSNSLPARIVANVFIWVLFVVGYFHILVNQDYILGYSLSFLTLCKLKPIKYFYYEGDDALTLGTALALKQFAIKIIALQWIFAFTIFAVFFVGSLYISTTKYVNRDVLFRRIVEPEATDRERQPLLNEQ